MLKRTEIPTFLKWAGGKRRLINELDPLFPKKVDRYFEPFLGGGAVFFFVKRKYNPKFCMLSDINKDLIDTFKTVRDNPLQLLCALKNYKRRHSEKFYYHIREKFNAKRITGLERHVAFIYLNKTCYNGLYRVNFKGEFNVPYGKYNNPEIFNKQIVLHASQLLQGVIIKQQHYTKITKFIKKGDFIYLDPCYDPIKKTSFVNYTAKRFCDEDRMELAKFIEMLKNKCANIVLSNNDLPRIRDIYSDFNIKEILALRSINSNVKKRGKIVELAISSC